VTAFHRSLELCLVDGTISTILKDFTDRIDDDRFSDLLFEEEASEIVSNLDCLWETYRSMFSEPGFAEKFVENEINLDRFVDLIYSSQYYFPLDTSKDDYLIAAIQIQTLLYEFQGSLLELFLDL
jgi:hypothetical protein